MNNALTNCSSTGDRRSTTAKGQFNLPSPVTAGRRADEQCGRPSSAPSGHDRPLDARLARRLVLLLHYEYVDELRQGNCSQSTRRTRECPVNYLTTTALQPTYQESHVSHVAVVAVGDAESEGMEKWLTHVRQDSREYMERSILCIKLVYTQLDSQLHVLPAYDLLNNLIRRTFAALVNIQYTVSQNLSLACH